MRYNLKKSRKMPKEKEIQMTEMNKTKSKTKRTDVTDVERELIRGADNIMDNVKKLMDKKDLSKAHRMLDKGLKILSVAISNQKGDTSLHLHQAHKEMTKMLGHLTSMLNVPLKGKRHGHDLIHAERTRSKTAHKLDAKSVVQGFIDALDKKSDEPGVKTLVSEMEGISRDFLNHGDLKKYKNECNHALENHKNKYYKTHHRQPKGVFEHITNVVRAMFRLLEKMINYVFGTKLSMFKKEDSPLGKLTKDFQQKLKGLAEYEKRQENSHKLKNHH